MILFSDLRFSSFYHFSNGFSIPIQFFLPSWLSLRRNSGLSIISSGSIPVCPVIVFLPDIISGSLEHLPFGLATITISHLQIRRVGQVKKGLVHWLLDLSTCDQCPVVQNYPEQRVMKKTFGYWKLFGLEVNTVSHREHYLVEGSVSSLHSLFVAIFTRSLPLTQCGIFYLLSLPHCYTNSHSS